VIILINVILTEPEQPATKDKLEVKGEKWNKERKRRDSNSL